MQGLGSDESSQYGSVRWDVTDKGHTDEIIATWHVASCMLAFESGSNLVGFGLVVVPRNIGQGLSAM